jgi:hypothetical protein
VVSLCMAYPFCGSSHCRCWEFRHSKDTPPLSSWQSTTFDYNPLAAEAEAYYVQYQLIEETGIAETIWNQLPGWGPLGLACWDLYGRIGLPSPESILAREVPSPLEYDRAALKEMADLIYWSDWRIYPGYLELLYRLGSTRIYPEMY